MNQGSAETQSRQDRQVPAAHEASCRVWLAWLLGLRSPAICRRRPRRAGAVTSPGSKPEDGEGWAQPPREDRGTDGAGRSTRPSRAERQLRPPAAHWSVQSSTNTLRSNARQLPGHGSALRRRHIALAITHTQPERQRGGKRDKEAVGCLKTCSLRTAPKRTSLQSTDSRTQYP